MDKGTPTDLAALLLRFGEMEKEIASLRAELERKDKIIAGLGVAYVPFLWNPAVLQADELFWWGSATQTTAAMRVLRFTLERMRERAGDRQAMAVFHKLTSSPASVAAIYRRLGLREVQTSDMGII